MSAKPKFSLKLNTGSSNRSPSISNSAHPPATPASATPSTAKSIKLRISSAGSKASTPIESAALPASEQTPSQKLTKVPRARKPSAKVLAQNANGKRDHSDSEDDRVPPVKKAKKAVGNTIKLNLKATKTPTTPIGVKLKVKGKPPVRPHGEGYDSEASDREIDPSIEEQFVLRFDDNLISASGVDCSDDCEYIHQMIRERKIGHGAEIWLKFYHSDGRRAVVTVRKNHYAATLVDMPTISESMKSFDKKTWMKTADVSQMLLVFARIPRDTQEEAQKIDLPRDVHHKTYEFPHGLTPPMRYARNRRFKDRPRRTEIEAVEAEVDRLLREDAKAEGSTVEWFDPEAPSRDTSRVAVSEGSDRQQSGYGSPDASDRDEPFVDGGAVDDQHGPDLSIQDIEDALLGAFENVEEPASPGTEAETPIITGVATPIDFGGITPAVAEGGDGSEESPYDSGDETSGDDSGEEEMDEEQRAKQAARAAKLEDIADMEKQLAESQATHDAQNNQLLRRRIMANIENMKHELMLKKAAIEGMEDA